MEVILLKDVPRVGTAGQTIAVKDGYARNFLLPKGLALAATRSARTQAELQRAAQLRQTQLLKAKASEMAERLKGVSCTIPVAVGDHGKLHGAVTSGDILKALEAQGIVIEKHHLLLEKPLTQCGSFSIPIKLHPEVATTLQVLVVRQ